jgi:hypothetical protein
MLQRATLNQPESAADLSLFGALVASRPRNTKQGRCAMGVALEVNFALWIMMGCALAKAIQFVEYLN